MKEFNTYFYGEFGFLNWSILGMLECVAKVYPEYIFNVATFPDYLTLMQKMNPNVRKLDTSININEHDPKRDTKRSGYKFDEHKEYLLQRAGNIRLPDIVMKLIESNYTYIECPIVYPSKPLNSHVVTPPGKYISVCCRKRKHEKFRNFDPEMCRELLNGILKLDTYKNHTVIFHGLKSEVSQVKGNFPGSLHVENIEEAIAYLKASDFFIGAVLSGYTQFASNCGTDVIHIGTIKDTAGPFGYNPFTTALELAPDAPSALEIISQLKI